MFVQMNKDEFNAGMVLRTLAPLRRKPFCPRLALGVERWRKAMSRKSQTHLVCLSLQDLFIQV